MRFENWARARILAGDDKALVAYEDFGKDAKLAVPTPEHYLPLLYVLALRGTGEIVRFPTEGIDGGSVSMLSVAIGL
jgi:4,5-DOPA dioxygenase extradiol